MRDFNLLVRVYSQHFVAMTIVFALFSKSV
jgi:hypothetical protein